MQWLQPSQDLSFRLTGSKMVSLQISIDVFLRCQVFVMLFQSVSSILIVFCSKRVSHCFSVFILMSLFSWVFPKIGVPPNHPLQNRVFHYFQPSILGIPPFKETPSSIIKGKNTKLWHHRFLTSAKNRNIAFLFLWILIGNLRKPNKTTTFITPNN